MTSNNEKTLETYAQKAELYIANTQNAIDGKFKDFLESALRGLNPESKIFEIGSGFGRDALYMQSKGYVVETSDAVEAFVDVLKSKGLAARHLNVLSDPLAGPYDLVFANAVLLHFTRDETKQVLRKIHASLKDGGRFAFSVKKGEGEAWSTDKLQAPRYYCYWQDDQIEALLQETGFEKKLETSDSGEKSQSKWLRVLAEKKKA